MNDLSQLHSGAETSQPDVPYGERGMQVRQEVRDAEAMLAARYGIATSFVRVGMLSKILGIADASIYAAMRSGRFFIPHRMLLSAPAVQMEDLARWYCDAGEDGCLAPEAEAKARTEGRRAAKAGRVEAARQADKAKVQRLIDETMGEVDKGPGSRERALRRGRKAASVRLAAEVLGDMQRTAPEPLGDASPHSEA